MVDQKTVIDCKFRDYLNPTEVKSTEPKPLNPKDFDYENKLKLKEEKQ